MSEQPSESTEQQPQEGATEKAEPKTFDADYVDKLRKESAKYRTEAKANADAAARLQQIEEANKTEVQKAAERLAAAEKATKEAQREAVRFRVAAKFSISDEHADLYLHGDDEETLTRQAQGLRKLLDESGKPRAPRPDPTQGRANDSTDVDAQARRILLGH